MPFAAGLEIAGKAERVINDQKVTDHHAIIPTDSMPGRASEIAALIPDMRLSEKKGYYYSSYYGEGKDKDKGTRENKKEAQ